MQREQLKKRRLDSLNKLFLKWDNEGSGHLLTDDVVKVLNGYRDGNFVDQIQKCTCCIYSVFTFVWEFSFAYAQCSSRRVAIITNGQYCTVHAAREDLKWKVKKDKRITKKLFRFFFTRVAWHVNANDMVEPLVDFCNLILDVRPTHLISSQLNDCHPLNFTYARNIL